MIERLIGEKIWSSITAYGRLIRIRNSLIAFLGVFVGATIVHTGTEIVPVGANVIIAAFIAFLITSAGNSLNDYFDVEIDKINRPDRPIPSGKVSRSDALMLSVAMFLIGLGLAKYINPYCLIIAGINTIILVFYARYSKKLLLVSNFAISYLVASVFIFGAVSLFEKSIFIEILRIKLAIILAACAFFITFSREIIKDIEDIEGDMKEYSKTLATVIGIKKSRNVAVVLGMIAIFLSFLPIFLRVETLDLIVYSILIVIADLIFISSLTMYAPLGQRAMIVGMVLSLLAFFVGNIMTKV